MSHEYVVYGQKGSGSVIVEAALTLLGLPYRVVEVSIDPGDADPVLAKVNPMRQAPALVLPNGELMTESAAILIWLADSHPEARLAPTMAAHARPAFLRWMAFVSSAIYALYWIRDDPARVIDDAVLGQVAKDRLRTRIHDCWAIMDGQIDPGRYVLGDDLTVLDLYVAVVTRWAGGRGPLEDRAPKLLAIARRVDADPRLRDFWAKRFPFE